MINSKDILARLLATENLTVVHQNVRTASFNVKDRVLTLPIWEDMEAFTYDHLVGHEVGHALYTPLDGWHDSVSTRGPAFKSFLNVIEDARIEKLIQRKYPGLRRSFVKSYTKMMDEGFFGDDIDGINKLGLIDRINTYFKCGRSAGVRIEADEMVWVNEIEVAETWEQVVDIADRMYAKAKAEEEEKQAMREAEEPDPQDEWEDEDEDVESTSTDGDSDDAEDEESTETGSSSTAADEGEEEEGEVEETAGSSPSAGATGEPMSKTDEALRDSIAEELSNDLDGADIYNLNNDYSSKIASKFIVGYKEILKDFADLNDTTRKTRNGYDYQILQKRHWETKDYAAMAEDMYVKFMANNKKTINYLVKEFEMKKSAAQYARATTAKTGVIDPVLMNTYRYNDDIFRKATIVPDGKNHGMIMYLDWSGSMSRDLFNTVEQTLNLVMFCRQVGIPFRVYAFTSQWDRMDEYEDLKIACPSNAAFPENGFRLLEFFNNKMNKQQLAKMSKILLLLAKEPYDVQTPYRLGGTPLESAILLAPAVFNMFQKDNRVDVVNTVFLTDGDSHSAYVQLDREVDGCEYRRSQDIAGLTGYYRTPNIVSMTCPVTKKRYRLRKGQITKTLLKMYGDTTGSNVIGFRIMSSSKHHGVREIEHFGFDYTAASKIWSNLAKEKYVSVTGVGYDKFFILKGGKNLETSNGAFEVAEDAKKGQITTAFKKANKSKLVSRSLLNEFIKEVA
jgi:hypothetical protein